MNGGCGCLKVRTRSLTRSIHVHTNVWLDTEAGESRDDSNEATAEQSTSPPNDISDSDEVPSSAASTDKDEEHDKGVVGILHAGNQSFTELVMGFEDFDADAKGGE
jgi:hypothetical protein